MTLPEIIRRRLPGRTMRPYERHAVGFLLSRLAMGAGVGFAFGGLLLALDAGDLRTLIFNGANTALVLVMLFLGLFVTFGSAGMGLGVMGLGEERD